MLTESGTYDTGADLENCEYALWMGTFPGSTGKSFQGISKRTLDALATGRATMDVVDPVLGSGCVTPTIPGIRWVPIRTATNGAFSSAIVRWMIENNAYNAQFLSYPNYKAGTAGGYASYTNASHLVIVDETSKNYRKCMRAADAGIESPGEVDATGKALEYYVVIDKATGQPALHSATSEAQIDFEGEVNGIKVKTAFLMLKESVNEYTMDEYAKITDISVAEIERIAKEFTSHGVKASANSMGGTATANGTEGAFAYRLLNAMIGSNQMTGGSAPRRVSAKTSADGTQYKLSTIAGKPSVSAKTATYISRNAKAWAKTDEYAARVAAGEKDPKPKLPWFPGSTTADNQALTSIVNQYPYQCKILFAWMSNTIEATPGMLREETMSRLEDPAVVPLFIACDVMMGEMAQMADYIVPDTTPYESFGVVTQEGYWPGRGNAVRWRAKNPESIQLSDGRYASYEAFICDVARACDLPGFGDDAIAGADGTLYPFNDAPDFFLKAVANLAYDTTAVDDIDSDEMKLQALDELPDAWKSAVTTEEWPKVLHVLSRGGRFWPIEKNKGEGGRSAYAKEFESYIYSEGVGANKNVYSGTYPAGTLHYSEELMSDGTPITDHFDKNEYPYASTNYKPRFRSISMQANSPIMRDLCAHNYLEINRDDAASLGIADGDQVRITSAGGDVMEGMAMVRAGIAAGTFAVAYGYGHHAYGTQAVTVGDTTTEGNPAIGAGVHLQTMKDPTITDAIYFLTDNDATSPGRNGGMYRIEKA